MNETPIGFLINFAKHADVNLPIPLHYSLNNCLCATAMFNRPQNIQNTPDFYFHYAERDDQSPQRLRDMFGILSLDWNPLKRNESLHGIFSYSQTGLCQLAIFTDKNC